MQHDMQTYRLAAMYENAGRKMPKWLSAATIIPSFMQTYLHAVGTTLDVPNWGSNWDTYIKRSFDVRRTVPSP
jgi:filamentous hemagglutinin